jgi:hypothetical protein
MYPSLSFLVGMQFPKGASAAGWVQALSLYLVATALTPCSGWIHSFSSSYVSLLQSMRHYTSSTTFQYQSRKVALHAVDSLDRIARSTLGEESAQTAEKVIGGAVETAGQAMDRVGLSPSTGAEEMQHLFVTMCLTTPFACVPLSVDPNFHIGLMR